MRIDLEQSITVIFWVLAAFGILYFVWPLFVKAIQVGRHKANAWRDTVASSPARADDQLTHYEQLVKLLNDDIQVVSLLLQKLANQFPGQTEDWYCQMALKQMQVWIISRISAARNDNYFGEKKAIQYLAKYGDRPVWWVYRKLAVDYDLFRDGFNQAPTDTPPQPQSSTYG